MNQLMTDLSRNQNLACDSQRNLVYGNFRGYAVILEEKKKQETSLTLSVKEERDGDIKDKIDEFLNLLKMDYQEITYCNFNGMKLEVVVRAYLAEHLNLFVNVMGRVTEYLYSQGMVNSCQVCGNAVDAGLSRVNGKVGIRCNACMGSTARTIVENPKGNLLLGILGALLGSIPGVIVWVVIYQLNFIAGISGFLMVYGAFYGYKKLGKRNDMIGIVISCIFAVIMIVVSEAFCVVFEGMETLGITFSECVQYLKLYYKEALEWFEIAKDIVFGLVLAIWAALGTIKKLTAEANQIEESVRL